MQPGGFGYAQPPGYAQRREWFALCTIISPCKDRDGAIEIEPAISISQHEFIINRWLSEAETTC